MLLPTSTVILDCKRNNVGLTEMTTQLECELKQKMKTNVLLEREGNNIHSQAQHKIKDVRTNCIHCLLVDVPMYSVHNILNSNSTFKQDNRKRLIYTQMSTNAITW